MNIAGISGRLTSDVEVKTTGSGKSVISFTVAVRRPGTKDVTDFIDCVAWDYLAEFVGKHFTKGQLIEVSGTLNTNIYGNGDNRKKRTEINCANVQFGGPKKEETPASLSTPNTDLSSGFSEVPVDDDLPF